MSDVAPVRTLLRRVARRLRAQRAIEAISTMLIISGAWMILAVFLVKIRHLGPAHLTLILGLALFFPLTALLVSLLRPIRPMVAAQIVDRRLGLKDRLGSAYDFATRAEKGELSPYAETQIKDAADHAVKVKVGEAVPYRFPRRLFFFVVQLLVVAVLVVLPAFPEPSPVQAAPPPPDLQGMAVEFDELDGFNEFLRDVHQDALDEELDEVAQAAEEFNKLLQDLADQRLPYREALDRIANLEQKLAREGWERDPEAEQFLKQVGLDLAKAKVTKEAGEALRDNKLREARDEMRKASEEVKREAPDRRRLEELRRALKRASKRQPPDYEERMKRLKQERRRLKQKTQKNQQSQRNKRRLKRNKRELEKLRRDLQQHRERQRQLERLQRDLQQMAESLNMRASPELEELMRQMQQMSEDLNRMAQEQQSEQQMQQLRQRLEELRRLLQQLQRGGKGFKLRLGQFNKGARGGKSCKSGGQGKGGKGGKTITLTPGGRGGKGGLQLLMKKGGQGGKQGGQQSKGGNKGGQGAGDSHDPNQGDPTKMKARYTDVQVSPQQSDGPSKSQVIETAADQGFSTRGYEKVHKSYNRHAESLLEKQDVPPGYRRYIRLYFERIRPR